jgi:hypothetical protein
MSDAPSTRIDIEFADGAYTFRLGLAQIAELQAKCGCGIGALYARVIKGRYIIDGEPLGNPMEAQFFAADLIETVRQGLIGGRAGVVDDQTVEVKPADANRLVSAYLYPERPLTEAWALAASILAAAIDGYSPPDKKKEAPATAKPAVKAASTMRKRSPTAR